MSSVMSAQVLPPYGATPLVPVLMSAWLPSHRLEHAPVPHGWDQNALPYGSSPPSALGRGSKVRGNVPVGP